MPTLHTDPREASDQATADAFAYSWNIEPGLTYSSSQAWEWLAPITRDDLRSKRVLELGCGNGSLLFHLFEAHPAFAQGVDLGDALIAARKNLSNIPGSAWALVKEDLTTYRSSEKFDLTYCIGVLHHLTEPARGFQSVLENTKPGGKFHCWVYGYEGNAPVRFLVEPIRRACRFLPHRVVSLIIAPPFGLTLWLGAKIVSLFPACLRRRFPLGDYLAWISKSPLRFSYHVVVDQLIARRTRYFRRSELERLLADHGAMIESTSIYILPRNGNSWKFGGIRR